MPAGADFPIVERTLAPADAAGVPPPFRLAVNYHHVTADMVALQQGRPEMARLVCRGIIRFRSQGAAAGAHAFQVVDRLGEDRIEWRANPVGRCLEVLAQGDGELVINPAMPGIPQ